MKNYGNKKQEVRANLIVCEGQLVGRRRMLSGAGRIYAGAEEKVGV